MSEEPLLLDTCAFLDWARGDDPIAKRVLAELERAAREGRVYLSALSVQETLRLAEKGKLVLRPTPLSWVQRALRKMRLAELAFTSDAALEAGCLHDINGDPVDEGSSGRRSPAASRSSRGTMICSMGRSARASGPWTHAREERGSEYRDAACDRRAMRVERVARLRVVAAGAARPRVALAGSLPVKACIARPSVLRERPPHASQRLPLPAEPELHRACLGRRRRLHRRRRSAVLPAKQRDLRQPRDGKVHGPRVPPLRPGAPRPRRASGARGLAPRDEPRPGRAYVELRGAEGAHYVLSRGGGDRQPRVESPKSAQGISWASLSASLFPIRFVGHGELALLATNGRARLDLLTRFAQRELEPIDAELGRVRRELDESAVPLARLNREIAGLAKTCATLPPQRARLDELKKAAGGDPATLDDANARKALRERERMMLERAEREVAWLGSEVGVFVATARRRLGQVADDEAARGPNADLLADASAHVAGLGELVESLATRIAEECERGRGLFASRGRTLAARHAPEDDACRALLAKHESNAGRAFERLTLEKNVAELERAQADLDARENERAQVVLARDVLRTRLRSLLDARGETFDRTAEAIGEKLGDRVKIVFEREAERSLYRALLGELTKGKRFEKEDLDTVSRSVMPDDLCAQVMRGDTSVLEDKLGSKAVAMRLAAVLLESPSVYRLETVDLADLPTISLRDGKELKPSDQLSSGQRIVLFAELLLLDNRGPLVMDQPEDNVANPYLAQHLCRVFAEAQKEAQLIFVTHNGNVPILGRFERVFEMAADGERGRVAAKGAAKEVLTPMENNFEGGRGAFVARRDFYGVT